MNNNVKLLNIYPATKVKLTGKCKFINNFIYGYGYGYY